MPASPVVDQTNRLIGSRELSSRSPPATAISERERQPCARVIAIATGRIPAGPAADFIRRTPSGGAFDPLMSPRVAGHHIRQAGRYGIAHGRQDQRSSTNFLACVRAPKLPSTSGSWRKNKGHQASFQDSVLSRASNSVNAAPHRRLTSTSLSAAELRIRRRRVEQFASGANNVTIKVLLAEMRMLCVRNYRTNGLSNGRDYSYCRQRWV